MFVLIVLVWFYVLAMVILLGAVLNAYRAHPSGGTAADLTGVCWPT